MVLPICQRVTYCRYWVPGIMAAVTPGWLRSATLVVTVTVWPFEERRSPVDTMSRPGTFAPPITGYRASPEGSLIPLTGVCAVPLTAVPNSPIPEDCRATVTMGAPA